MNEKTQQAISDLKHHLMWSDVTSQRVKDAIRIIIGEIESLHEQLAEAERENERLERLRSFDTYTEKLPPGLMLEHVKLDALWQKMVKERDQLKQQLVASEASREKIRAVLQRGVREALKLYVKNIYDGDKAKQALSELDKLCPETK